MKIRFLFIVHVILCLETTSNSFEFNVKTNIHLKRHSLNQNGMSSNFVSVSLNDIKINQRKFERQARPQSLLPSNDKDIKLYNVGDGSDDDIDPQPRVFSSKSNSSKNTLYVT